MQGTQIAPEYCDGSLQDVLIVGGGIAGLATALAFHRMGLKSLVLESSNELRTSGGGIGLWTNAWKALEVLGVADGLREKYDRVSVIEFSTADGSLLANLSFNDVRRDVEVRAVIRKSLLQALTDPLPDGIIVYGARVSNICKLDGGHTEVECANGQKIRTKVLVGCDGVGSVVGNWLGLTKPQHVGYTAIRGLAIFPEENKLKRVFKQIVGKGVRVGFIPINNKSAFWFVVFNTKGNRIDEPELIREEALMYVRGWSDSTIAEAIKNSPLDSLSRRDIADRWTWPGVISGTALYQGGVTVAGDALHPMTPNLAQGGCCALEDAIVLARHVGNALRMSKEQGLDGRREMELIENALKTYTQERWPRTLAITIRAYIIGAVLQAENGMFCCLRNALLPRLMNVDRFTAHTFFDCGSLSSTNN